MKKEKLFCKWFNESKGYGYMVRDLRNTHDQDQYFIHYKSIDMEGYQTINEGQEYDCITEKTLKGYSVIKCEVIK